MWLMWTIFWSIPGMKGLTWEAVISQHLMWAWSGSEIWRVFKSRLSPKQYPKEGISGGLHEKTPPNPVSSTESTSVRMFLSWGISSQRLCLERIVACCFCQENTKSTRKMLAGPFSSLLHCKPSWPQLLQAHVSNSFLLGTSSTSHQIFPYSSLPFVRSTCCIPMVIYI